MKVLLVIALFALTTSIQAFNAEKTFKRKCSSCHTIGAGDEGKNGPDLAGLSARRTSDWIVKFVKYPEGMIMSDDEEPGYEKVDKLSLKLYKAYNKKVMPEQDMDAKDIKALVKYIDAQGKKPKGKILKFLKKK